jgi:hypothetical protein
MLSLLMMGWRCSRNSRWHRSAETLVNWADRGYSSNGLDVKQGFRWNQTGEAFAGNTEREGNSNALGLKGEVAEMCACLSGSRRQHKGRSFK